MGHWFLTVCKQCAKQRFWLLFLTAAMLLGGCGGKETKAAKNARTEESEDQPVRALLQHAHTLSANGSSQDSAASSILPPDQRKTCFACEGLGLVPCRVIACRGGRVDCPGGCLKLTQGVWTHMDVQGHNSEELWQKFPGPNGGYIAWNSHHLGEVIAIVNGEAVNLGTCKICGGTTKVTCQVCAGTGKQTCEVCQGRRYVPLCWTASDNPWLNSQSDLIRLRDGRALLGKVSTTEGSDRIIRTRDGKTQHIDESDIIPRSEYCGTNNTPMPTL